MNRQNTEAADTLIREALAMVEHAEKHSECGACFTVAFLDALKPFRGQPTALPLTVTIDEAARMIGISRGYAYELAKDGRLPGAIHLGRRIVVSRSKLLAAINSEQ